MYLGGLGSVLCTYISPKGVRDGRVKNRDWGWYSGQNKTPSKSARGMSLGKSLTRPFLYFQEIRKNKATDLSVSQLQNSTIDSEICFKLVLTVLK